MKKLFLALVAVGSIASANAQAPKDGSILIYGNVGFGSMKAENDPGTAGAAVSESKTNMFNINPGIGYQFNRNWTVGLNFGLTTTKLEDNNGVTTDETKTRDMNIGPFIRHTQILSPTFFVFNQLNLNYLSGRRLVSNFGVPDQENTYNGFGANWFPAIGISVSRTVALNFQFGGLEYARATWDIDASPAEQTVSGFNFTFGQQANIGISVNLGGRHMRGNMEPGSDTRRLDVSDDTEE